MRTACINPQKLIEDTTLESCVHVDHHSGELVCMHGINAIAGIAVFPYHPVPESGRHQSKSLMEVPWWSTVRPIN